MAITFDDTFSVLEKTFSGIGLSGIYLRKSSDTSRLYFQRAMYVFGLCHLIVLVSWEGFYIIKLIIDDSTGKFLKAAEAMPCIIVSFFCMIKSVNLVIQKKSVVKLVEGLRELWPSELDEETNKIVQQSMAPTRQLILIYSIVTNGLPVVYNSFPLVIMLSNYLQYGVTEMLLPYYVWYPTIWDWSRFNWRYGLTYISQCYAGLFSTCAVSCLDGFFCMLIAQLCMQLKLLCKDIHNASDGEFIQSVGASKLSINDKLKRAVQHHNKLISITNELEGVFSLVLLFNLVLSSLVICVLLFSITIAPPGVLVKYLMFFSSCMTQILMMSWYGNKLIEESDSVSGAAFYSKWTDLVEESDRKDYLFGIMMIQSRCKRPIVISAMGFSNISMPTFASILSAAWSYFTLLRSVYENEIL